MTYYIPKTFLKTRDEFNGPDRFFNLTKLIQDLSTDAGDLSTITSDISDLQTDLGTVETIAKTHIVNVLVTPHTTSVAALQTAAFVVPSGLNGMVLKEARIRHGVASTGATGGTTVQVLKNSTSMVVGDDITIAAQALAPASAPVPNATTVATGDPVFVYVSAIPAGGTAPTGLYATLVFGEA